jgi:hypothetical protein
VWIERQLIAAGERLQLAFATNSPATGVNIYTIYADGSGLAQVTQDGSDKNDDPVWGTHPPVG